MKRQLRLLPLSLALLGASSVHAAGPQLNIHKALDAAPTANASRRIDTNIGTIASVDERSGVPTFVWVAPPPAAGFSSRMMTRPAEEIARDFVTRNMDLYSLSSAALDTTYVREVHDTGTGGIIVLFAQKVDGLEVWRNEMKVLIDRQGDVIAVAGNLHEDAVSTTNGGAKRVFNVALTQAIANAFDDRTGIKILGTNLVDAGREENGYRYFDLSETVETKRQGIVFATQARAKKVLYTMPDRLVPAYYLELDMGKVGSASADLWGYVVSAETGELLERDHLTQAVAFNYKLCAHTTGKKTTLDGPIADRTPHTTGVTNCLNTP
jgi:large repetitive protein